MYSLAYIRRCYPCFIILAVIGLAQFYIFVMNDPLAGYMRNTLSSIFSKEPKQKSVAYGKRNAGPVHVLLLSYARTGGAFVGDLLQSYPNSFYFFEPLHFFGDDIITTNIPEPKLMLRRLFHCQTSKIPGYMDWQKTFRSYMKLERSHGYWEICTNHDSCFDSEFMDLHCSRKSAVVVRTSRITLREASALYDDFPELNLKIIYLMRDPRATMNSRTRPMIRDWCKNFKTCYDPTNFCSILQDDLKIACKLQRERPDDFTILRFEDLCREPYEYANSLANQYGYNSTNEMQQFLKHHTTGFVENAGDGLHYVFNTYRNSLMASSMWRDEMIFEDAALVQKECKDVLEAYGYYHYDSVHVMKSEVNLDKDLLPSIKNYCFHRA